MFVLVVLGISYPFQGAYVYGRFIARGGFAGAGWGRGRARHYLLAMLLPLVFWLLPSLAERVFGSHTPMAGLAVGEILLAIGSGALLTLLPAFGEEFAWRPFTTYSLTRYGTASSKPSGWASGVKVGRSSLSAYWVDGCSTGRGGTGSRRQD